MAEITTEKLEYKELTLNSSVLEIPRESYQRELNINRLKKMVAEFDERIANDPKVSSRDGHYYVFDGQHTIAARKILNGNRDVNIRCRVYTGLTEQAEAFLFAQQTGVSAPLSAGMRLRALIFAEDPEALAFQQATNEAGFLLDFQQEKGKKRLGCVSTALTEYRKLGRERYIEALKIILKAWDGDEDSLRRETLQGITRFIDLYHDEYDQARLTANLHRVDPIVICRKGKASPGALSGYKRYMEQVLILYNGKSKHGTLQLKF